MPTYPLTFPARIPAEAGWTPRNVTGASISPFTLTEQVQAHQGQRWEVALSFPPLTRAQALELRAFVLALRGRYGTFLWAPPAETDFDDDPAGTPVIDGAGQAGDEINTRGWTDPSTRLFSDTDWTFADTDVLFSDVVPVLAAGRFIQLGTGAAARLHQVTADAHVADAAIGGATLELWPAVTLAAALADAQAVTWAAPAGLFRLAADDIGWSTSPGQIHDIALSIVSVP